MKWLLVIALILPAMVQAQDSLQVSKRPTAGEVATAKATIQAAQDSPTMLAYGGYAVIDIKLEGKLTSYVVPGSDDCLRTVSIPKGQGYQGWLVGKGETAPKWTVIEPITTHDRLLATGTSNGTTTLIWMTVQNGEAVVVAAFKFVVGKPAPKPDDPVDPEDPLTSKMQPAYGAESDSQKATHKANIVEFYRSSASRVGNYQTWGQLYADMQKVARSPEINIFGKMTGVQGIIGNFLKQELPFDDANKIDDASKKKGIDTFNRIAKAVEALK